MSGVPRGTIDPIAAALAFAIREAIRLEAERAAEADARRHTMTVVDGGRRGGKAA